MRSVAWAAWQDRHRLGGGVRCWAEVFNLWRERLQAGGKAALERGRGRPPGSNRNQFHSQPSVQLSCGSQNWSLLGRKQWNWIFSNEPSACQGSSRESYQRWRQGVYGGIEATLSFEGVGLTVERQCQLAEVSRAGFYRYLQQTLPDRRTCCCAHACRS